MTHPNPKFVNKELSWLSFNARVLKEASDPSVPLMERLKFLGIYSSNLDEFFRVRVATLHRLADLGKKTKKILDLNPKKVIKEIQTDVLSLQKEFDRVYKNILKDLARENIFIINEKQLNTKQGDFVKSYFHQEVRPKLLPIMIDQVDNFPDLRDRAIYLSIYLIRDKNPKKPRRALVEVPTDVLSRFLILPRVDRKKYVIFLDDVIRYGLTDFFSIFQFDRFEAYAIKLTRDAELDIDDDLSRSYIDKVAKSLKKRQEGNLASFFYDSKMPQDFLVSLIKELQLTEDDTIIPDERYHNFKDFMDFPNIGARRLHYKPIPILPHKDLDRSKSLFQAMQKKDNLLHYPYQSFQYVIDLLREASIDPKVTSIKVTLYRVAKNSNVVHALINAVKNGKAVIVVMELQARFDEEANVYWANRLQEEGARVIFGVPGLKVHSKLCLITRKEKGQTSHYAIIGTGNFNEDTAKLYSDHNLFTADRQLTLEAKKVFDFYENNYKNTTFKHLLVSPFNLRRKFIRLIQNEIQNCEEGKDAYIILKLNNLVDTAIIKKLYQASRAGVKIRLNVRSMLSLVPGVPELSENIEAINIVDKYLEHTRIFVFCNNGSEKYYISSADLMPRNLDRRVEVTCPIYDKELQQELREFLDIQWSDNVKARHRSDKLYNFPRRKTSRKQVRAQFEIYDHLKLRLMKEQDCKNKTL